MKQKDATYKQELAAEPPGYCLAWQVAMEGIDTRTRYPDEVRDSDPELGGASDSSDDKRPRAAPSVEKSSGKKSSSSSSS